MDEQSQLPPAVTYSIVVPDAAELPLLHVNALNVRAGVDEFFLTFAVVIPPEYKNAAEAAKAATEGMQLTAQPLFRCAVSPETMNKFLTLIQTQLRMHRDLVERLLNQQMQGHTAQQEGMRDE